MFHKNLNSSTGLYSLLHHTAPSGRFCLTLALLAGVLLSSGCGTSPHIFSNPSVPRVPQSYQAIVATPSPVILKFYTEFCYDCQQIAPKLARVVQKTPQIRLVTIDMQKMTPAEKKLSQDLGVVTVPHVLYITASGKIIHRFLDNTDEAALQTAAADLMQQNKRQDAAKAKP